MKTTSNKITLRLLRLVLAALVGALGTGLAATSHGETVRFISQLPDTVPTINRGGDGRGRISDTVVPDLHFYEWDTIVFEGFEQTVVGCELVNDMAGTSDLIYTNPEDRLFPGTKLADIQLRGSASTVSEELAIYSASIVPEPSALPMLGALALLHGVFHRRR